MSTLGQSDKRFAAASTTTAASPVVEHYNGHFKLGLSDREKTDLIEYLKSL